LHSRPLYINKLINNKNQKHTKYIRKKIMWWEDSRKLAASGQAVAGPIT
jgi:hypothetical protein